MSNENCRTIREMKVSTRTFSKTKNCEECGTEFVMTAPFQKYCSEDCRNPLMRCPTCREMFRPKQRGYTTYCSPDCRYNAEGRKKDEVRYDGYVLTYVPRGTPGRRPEGRMLKHRYLMQQHLGRALESYEQVHHKDGNKQNNDISNLEIRVGPHGKGTMSAHCPTCTCFEHET